MTSVQNQGNQQIQTIQPQIKPQIQAQSAQQAPAQVIQPPPLIAPANNYATAPAVQTAPPPSYAGVNIQIYNPSVGIPNINPTGNMPQSQALPGIAYPSNYYTQQYGQPQNVIPQGGIVAQGGQGGNATINNYAGGISDGSANGSYKALTDNNANVLYEMGWARALDKKVVIVKRKNSNPVKSDIQNDTYHEYDDTCRSISLSKVIMENIIEILRNNYGLITE